MIEIQKNRMASINFHKNQCALFHGNATVKKQIGFNSLTEKRFIESQLDSQRTVYTMNQVEESIENAPCHAEI